MWWWQSVALAGAFVLAISVPIDHGTLTWARAGCAPATPAAPQRLTSSTTRRADSRRPSFAPP
jgi:hypothetical protein